MLEWLIAIAIMVGVAFVVTFIPLPPIVFMLLDLAVMLYLFVVTASFWGAGAEQIGGLIDKIPLLAKFAAVGVGIMVGQLVGSLIGIKRLK